MSRAGYRKRFSRTERTLHWANAVFFLFLLAVCNGQFLVAGMSLSLMGACLGFRPSAPCTGIIGLCRPAMGRVRNLRGAVAALLNAPSNPAR